MPVSTPTDAVTATRFSLTIDGYEIATFAELQSIVAEIEPVVYLESTDQSVHYNRLPGTLKPPTVVLKRGMNGSMELWAWHETVRKGAIASARRSCSLTMFNAEGKPVAKYYLEKAWPSKIDITGLKAGASEVMYETVTLVCENLQRVAP